MAVLQIDADQVQFVASGLGTTADGINQEIARINALQNQLAEAVRWQHIGAEDQMEQAKQQLVQAEQLLKEAQPRLIQVAQDARQTEAAIQAS